MSFLGDDEATRVGWARGLLLAVGSAFYLIPVGVIALALSEKGFWVSRLFFVAALTAWVVVLFRLTERH